MRLRHGRIALGPLPAEDIAEMYGSLWLPPSAADTQRYMVAEVVHAYEGSELIAGMRVVHRQFHFVEGDDLRIFWEQDILAVLTKGEDGMYTVVPLRNQVVVEEIPPDAYEGAIILVEEQQAKSLKGMVLAVGPGLLAPEWYNGDRLPLEVAVGDTIVYAKYAGTKLAIDGTDVLILDEDKILAKLTKEAV